MYYVYILQSEKDGSYYIGYTAYLEKRIESHNQGRSRYTRKKTPWICVYVEEYNNKKDALVREKYLKRMKSKKYLEKLVSVR